MKSKGLNRLFIYVLLSSLFIHANNTFAQISDGGYPPSFYYQQTLRSAAKTTEVPVDFYVADLQEVDNWQAREGKPMPVAKLIAVNYTIDNSGYWTTLPGGERIWRLPIKASDAYALMLYYNDFYIPEGGKLFIYSADRSQLLGAYTHSTHPSGGLFATEFISSDELILEYVASEKSDEKPRIEISDIGYGYNSAALRTFCAVTTRAASESCEVNINCEDGMAWQNEKKGVCAMVQKVKRASYVCTGTLMNNTAEDFKPLILTARHCAYGSSSSIVADGSDMKQWLFYFHRERERCENISTGSEGKSMVGCKLLAKTETGGQSDGMLLLLDTVIPQDYDVFYNGWDVQGLISPSGVCIHHPNGDYKKISTYITPITETTFNSTEFTGEKNASWNATFSKGVTEKGSSGSPLYNEKKLIIGTLTGGSSSCTNQGGLNIYGKMSYHWNKYPTDSTRMDKWLDPLNKGVKTLAGRYRNVLRPSPTNLKVINQGLDILVSWNKPNYGEEPVKYYVYKNNQRIAETTNLRYVDDNPGSGSLIYSVSAVYANDDESAFETESVLFTEYKAPTDMKAIRQTQYNVKLTWEAPVYEQTIYWGSMNPVNGISLGNYRDPFYYAQKWASSEIAAFDKKIVTAIRFFPIRGNSYEIYISQGENTYLQKIENQLTYSELNTVALKTPFVIDGTKSLIIGIHIYRAGSDYPAACDNGPAVDGKGNIYSFDGKTWSNLINSFDLNFVVAGIISSKEGELSQGNTKSGILLSKNISNAEANIKPRAAKLDMNNVPSLRSSQPTVFPTIKQYKIYRNNSFFKTVDASVREYIDRNASLSSNRYHVSAIYENDVESALSNEASIQSVDNANAEINAIDMFPTKFSNSVSLKGYDKIARIDVVSANGTICLSKTNPGNTLNTSSLGSGIYYFRFYGDNGEILRIVSGVKIDR